MATCTAEQSVHWQKIQRRLDEDHRTLVQHAIMAYLSTSIFIPIVAFQFAYKGPTFVQDEKWLVLTQIARRTLKMHREVRQSCRLRDTEKDLDCSGQSINTTNGSSVKLELTDLCPPEDAKDELNTVKAVRALDEDIVQREAVRFVV
ncbi:uncharacterized protein MELLADRAFT_106605 [Melampsora larici-populina 98AG31]|uniref:Uncharacterized protein n=1 Tax=Melampsora larici-populina (strain 98AG31 / pathotype 3-4-7) TaxID=747676 RepID=F4RM19_MELLP|nr:uncharacterized protein MELLADRAFT_106605 [Melampsora larici-populina 98AG31]EGG06665.1 hypothetical protein MELLADRAFT_106605 [Melampsora larici-populina 98AG31]